MDDVEQLRQFVEAELAENTPERVYAGVVLHLERLAAGLVQCHEFFFALFGIDVHTAELVHREFLAVFAYASLLEDDRPLRVANLDCQCAEQEYLLKSR